MNRKFEGGSNRSIGIAYVNQKQYAELNAQKLKNQRDEHCCCSFKRCQIYFHSIYNSKQRNVHCEIVFPLDDETSKNCLAFGAFADKGVKKMTRSFSNPSYHWTYLSVTDEEYTKAMNFCLGQVGKQFDSSSAGWRLLIWPPKSNDDQWWCASLVHAALIKMGLLKNFRLNTLDVDDIVQLLAKSRRVIPGKISPLEKFTVTQNCGRDMFGTNEPEIMPLSVNFGMASCN